MKTITFNFLSKLFQPQVYKRINEVLKKDIAKPLVLEFDITSNCNQNCVACISSNLLNKGEIPFIRIKSLLDLFSFAGIKAVVFTGGGEPLLHSEMPKPFFYAKELGLKIGLITNGLLLYKYFESLSGTLAWLRVSVDACEPDKYNLLHYNESTKKPKVFYNIISTLEHFAKNKGGTRLGFSFLVYIGRQWSGSIYDNASQIYNACKLAKNIGCDYFEIKPVVEQDHFLFLNKSELFKMNEQFKACKELEDEAFIVYSSESMQNFLENGRNLGREEFIQEKIYTRCFVAGLRTMVSPEGIFPCPYFRGNKKLGHLVNLKDNILTNDEYTAIINRISTNVNPAVDCNFYCIRHKQNILLYKVLSDGFQGDNSFRVNKHDAEKEDLFI